MSNVFIGILLGCGVGAWVYNKVYRSTGGNSKNALIVAGVAGFFAFVAMVFALGAFLK